MERHSHNLNTDGHSRSIFNVVSNKLSDWILVVTFVVKFILLRCGDRQTCDTHPEDIEDVGICGKERAIF